MSGLQWMVWGAAALVVGGLWWAGRRQLKQRALTYDKQCPKCGGHKWLRSHRSLPDHVFGLGLNVRRYRCANEACRWEGLRRRPNG